MGIKMDGKALADKICIDLKQRCENLKSKNLIPTVDIYTTNDDPIANMYLRSKLKRCQEIGIETVVKNCNSYDNFGIIRSIAKSRNPLIIEEPIPSTIDKESLCDILVSRTDLDGWSTWNRAKLYCNMKPNFYPCTPKGIMRLLKEYNVEFEGKNALVIGRSDIVGHPIAWMLSQQGCTVTMAHSKTNESDLINYAISADIIVSAVGNPNIIDFQEFNDECFGLGEKILSDKVVIDVGMNFENGILVGDFTEEFKSKTALWNSVRGCIGPMTTISLCENVIEFYEREVEG